MGSIKTTGNSDFIVAFRFNVNESDVKEFATIMRNLLDSFA
jgi:hypothetical protein